MIQTWSPFLNKAAPSLYLPFSYNLKNFLNIRPLYLCRSKTCEAMPGVIVSRHHITQAEECEIFMNLTSKCTVNLSTIHTFITSFSEESHATLLSLGSCCTSVLQNLVPLSVWRYLSLLPSITFLSLSRTSSSRFDSSGSTHVSLQKWKKQWKKTLHY